MIQDERIQVVNSSPVRNGRYVLYWMQASQRAECNHALEYAILRSNELRKPLIVYFGITDDYPEANERHYKFMLEGLKETRSALRRRGIQTVVRHESPETGALSLSGDACLVVMDAGYLRVQRRWRSHLAENAGCKATQVESDVIVPVATASNKEEYAAATFRPKVAPRLRQFLVPLEEGKPEITSLDMDFDSFDIDDIERALSMLNIDRSVGPVAGLHGGAGEARRRLKDFIGQRLEKYPALRNDPSADVLSNMSPYLHFGQVSALDVALRVSESDSPSKDAYLEELVVRRELGVNFVFYNHNYDSFSALPEWARKTLLDHQNDPREYVYGLEELENAATHDEYWNAAQREMVVTGKMHGYMRMYWGKRFVDWVPSPERAFDYALHLNNKYELDGRDSNGYTGVAWCFGKHDRPWGRRPVFGNVRYMSPTGLRRKFDADAYAKKWH